jgi:cell cycle checkpoint protein
MVPPAKRLKRPIVLSSDDSEDGRLIPAGSKETVAQKPRASPGKSRGNTAINKLPTRSRSRPKTNVSKRPVTSSALTSIGSQTKPTEKKHKSGSLYTFLNAAAQTQTVTTESKAILTTADIEADDYIQDDDSLDEAFEVLSQTLVERSDHANPDRPARGLSSRGESAPCKEILANTSQRFLPVSKGRKSNAAPAMTNVSVRDDRRPWADRYGPVNLEELAVHKKKVTDVQNWLENVFGGRDRKVRPSLPF